MGTLYYDREPGNQLLRNTAFPSIFAKNWKNSGVTRDVSFAAFPESSNDTNEYAGLEFSEVGAYISQESEDLAVSGVHTLSMLLEGNNESSIQITYSLFSEDTEVFTYTENLRNIVLGDFNNNYAVFTVPVAGTLGKITISLVGEEKIRISNPKMEAGSDPTRWSPYEL
jgi:hypothetical protein